MSKYISIYVIASGVVKAGSGQVHVQPKHHVHPAHVTQSCVKLVRARG